MENGVQMADAAATRTAAERAFVVVVVVVLAVCLNARRVFCPTNALLDALVVVVVARVAIIIIVFLFWCSVGFRKGCYQGVFLCQFLSFKGGKKREKMALF